MRRSDFVNPSDRGFEAQVAQFLANLGPVKTALGLPANWEAQLQTRKNNFTTALNSLDLAEANYRQAKQTKDAARRNLESEFRNLVRQLRRTRTSQMRWQPRWDCRRATASQRRLSQVPKSRRWR
jgi:hypothetical protein